MLTPREFFRIVLITAIYATLLFIALALLGDQP